MMRDTTLLIWFVAVLCFIAVGVFDAWRRHRRGKRRR